MKFKIKNSIFLILIIFISKLTRFITAKSIILANYHNVLLFFPKEYGGNDDLRVIFDVRNVTIGTFKYMPVVVDIAYDSQLNHAYCYLESAITSYIMLLKWGGGSWCYQVLFEFPASQFSKYMYHSIILIDNFLYWTTDRYIMSGRIPGYEKRLLLQPSWNRLYSMTLDRKKEIIYVAAFDYTENALFRCSLRVFSCTKLLTTEFTLNYIYFNDFSNNLYAASIQGVQNNFLYRYAEDFNSLLPVNTVQKEVANIIFLSEDFAIYTNQQSITIISNINDPNTTRRANAKLIDPYALQYIFTFNQILNFDTYPYPYFFTDYHDLLYKNSLYLFYFYICSMDYVENDYVFLPQMDLNNQFLHIENCQTRFLNQRDSYLIPSLVGGCVLLLLIVSGIMICCWRSKMCESRVNRLRLRLRRCCIDCCKKEKSQNKIYDSFQRNRKKFESESSGVSSIGSDKIENGSLRFYPSSVFDIQTYQNNQDLKDSELYDNDPTNLKDISYTKYIKKSKPKRSAKKDLSSKSHAVKSNPIKDKPITPILTTPTLSRNSTNSSFGHPSSISSPSSSVSAISNNRVKFNDFKIQHVYDQDDYPRHSKIYNQAKEYSIKLPTDTYYPNDQDYINALNKNQTSLSTSSGSSANLSHNSIDNEYKLSLNKLDKKLNKYINKDYVSTCDIRLYGSNNKSNYMNIVKSVDEKNSPKNLIETKTNI